jgi:hypothetical protein
MSDAIHISDKGTEALRKLLPTDFRWAWFWIALVLMSVPCITAARRFFLQTRSERNFDNGLGILGNKSGDCAPVLITEGIQSTGPGSNAVADRNV